MDMDFFKQENELNGLSIEDLKEKIKYELITNQGYEDKYKKKENEYLYEQYINIKKFLTEKLNFNNTDRTKQSNDKLTYDITFEFMKNSKAYRIDFGNNNKNNIIFLCYKFENNKNVELRVDIELADKKHQLKKSDVWSLESNPFFCEDAGDYSIKYKHVANESQSWYLKEYLNIKQIVEHNNKINTLIENETINKLFDIIVNDNKDEEKIYSGITDLVQDIIKS